MLLAEMLWWGDLAPTRIQAGCPDPDTPQSVIASGARAHGWPMRMSGGDIRGSLPLGSIGGRFVEHK
jgi:hypothetical protein